MSIFKSRVAAVAAGTLILAATATTGAVAASQIGSYGIADNSIRSVDLQDGAAVKWPDLADGLHGSLENKAEKAAVDALAARVAALEAQVAALEAQDTSGVNKDWAATDGGSTIVNADTVELRQFAADGLTRLDGGDGTSVEIQNLDLPIQAGDTVEFTYTLADGAVAGGGAPRVFIEVDGTFYNTVHNTTPDYGTPVAGQENTFRVSVTPVDGTTPVPNGRIGAAGVVYDNSAPGTVTVTDVVIAGHSVAFQ